MQIAPLYHFLKHAGSVGLKICGRPEDIAYYGSSGGAPPAPANREPNGTLLANAAAAVCSDVASVAAIIAVILAGPARNPDGSSMSQKTLFAEATSSHRGVRWRHIHSVEILQQRLAGAVAHAQHWKGQDTFDDIYANNADCQYKHMTPNVVQRGSRLQRFRKLFGVRIESTSVNSPMLQQDPMLHKEPRPDKEGANT